MRNLVLMVFLVTPVFAERIESYVDESGVKVITNIGTNRGTADREEGPAPSRLTQAYPGGLPKALARGAYYFPLIEEMSQRYGVDDDLVKAIISVESNYDPLAVSSKNCKGLMQLHPDTARRFGVLDVFDPSQNIEGGVKYLRFLMGHFQNEIPLVLAAYNAGENAVTRHQGIPPYRETREYVQKVQRLYNQVVPPISLEEPAAPRENRRIHRIVTPDGRVIFTNTPELALN